MCFVSDLLDPSSLLIELFSGDTGLRSPNPTNSFQMKKLGYMFCQLVQVCSQYKHFFFASGCMQIRLICSLKKLVCLTNGLSGLPV